MQQLGRYEVVVNEARRELTCRFRWERFACLLVPALFTLVPLPLWAYELGPATLLPDSYTHEITAAAIGAFAVSILILVRRWRGRFKRLEEQRNELSLAVMLKTREIRKEKEIIVRQKQQIEELLVKAQQSNRLKDEFLANISHEIRTPLHGVIGMTDLVLQTDLNEEQREYLELAESSAKSLLNLLNDVLDFSKIEAGGLTLERVAFSVRDCVEEAASGFTLAAAKKKLVFTVEFDRDVPARIEGDPLRLRQVLINLLSNAVKFTERGSIRLNVFTEDKGDTLSFELRDTGIGIPFEQLDAVFEPFRQADGSTTRKYGGTGLGLTICVRLAKQMGGELTLESKEGVGSTFTLRLPVVKPAHEDRGGKSGFRVAAADAA